MKQLKNNFIRVLGFALFFGLCIFMVSGVKAKAADTDPRLNLESCDVTVGGECWLRVYNSADLLDRSISFRSSDPSIATVNSKGKITGRNCGDVVITVIVKSGGSVVSTLQCDVHIGPAAVSIRFTRKELVLKEGTARRIYPLVIPKNTVEKPIYWSDDTSIATISAYGTVRAQGVGSVDVHGMIDNGDSDVCRVTVLSADAYEDYNIGRRSLEDILSDMSNTDAQESNTTEGEVTTTLDQSTVTPTHTVTPVAGVATAPVAGK